VLKPMFGLAATGVIALILWKLLAAFLLPLVAVAVGVVLIVIKLVFIVLAVMFAVWVFRRWSNSESQAA